MLGSGAGSRFSRGGGDGTREVPGAGRDWGVDGFLIVQEHGRRKRFLIITTGGHGVGLLGKLVVRRRG